MTSNSNTEQVTREALQQLLYGCMYTDKERKRIPNDGTMYLSDVEAAMSLHDALIEAHTERAVREATSYNDGRAYNVKELTDKGRG